MDKIFNINYEDDLVKNKIKNIKLYSYMFEVLHHKHLDKYVLYVNNYKDSGVKLSIFYKISNQNIMYIESFFLDCNYPLKYILNWQNFDHQNFDNYNRLSEVDFKLCYKIILNENGNLNFELLKGNIIEYDDQVIEKTGRHTDGYHINNNDFNFQIILWELLQRDYYNLNINNLRTSSFTMINVGENHHFYKKLYDTSIYLRYMIKKHSLFCDKCKKEIHSFRDKIKVNKHWEYIGIAHLCNKCYEKKKNKESDRKNYIKRLILLEGKKIVFKRKVQEFKNREFNFNQINDINFYKKIIKGLVLDINKNNKKKLCSICYDYFSDKKIAAGDCGHCFHLSCVNSLTSCPICRHPNPNFKELFF